MEMTPFLILRKALLGVAKLGDKHQICCLCQIVKKHTLKYGEIQCGTQAVPTHQQIEGMHLDYAYQNHRWDVASFRPMQSKKQQ